MRIKIFLGNQANEDLQKDINEWLAHQASADIKIKHITQSECGAINDYSRTICIWYEG